MNEFQQLFDDVETFYEKRQEQIDAGMSNYCLLNSVLRRNDETKLHSRFIYSLLNVKGEHLRKDLFLNELFNVIPEVCVFNDALSVKAYKEFNIEKISDKKAAKPKKNPRFIDLYLTNGQQHWIIENKLDAKDGKAQMKDYIEAVCSNKNGNPAWHDVTFIYLTNGKTQPSKKSRVITFDKNDDKEFGGLHIEFETISKGHGIVVDADGNKICRYVNLHYKTDIKKWIKACIKQLVDGSPLQHYLNDYLTVLKRYLKEDNETVMTLTSYLEKKTDESPATHKSHVEALKKIDEELPSLKQSWLVKVLESFTGTMEAICNDDDDVTLSAIGKQLSKYTYDFDKKQAASYFSDDLKNGKDKGRFVSLTSKQKVKLGFDETSDAFVAIVYGKKLIHTGFIVEQQQSNQDTTPTAIQLDSNVAVQAHTFDLNNWWTKTLKMNCYFASTDLSKEIWEFGHDYSSLVELGDRGTGFVAQDWKSETCKRVSAILQFLGTES